MTRTSETNSCARTARVETTHEEAALVAAALAPDDTDSMTTEVDANRIVTDIERETTGGLQATVDDYVVNLTVAEAVIDAATDTT
ncbi:KEOPS complex subunit Pcc1 [Haloprofundus halobius]|uniref:KEOPS complex subunit Pcc1 n=1 Tax=Haloprofundus halobius TaxID=2876194 RepID=UPI001CCC88D4|nr:KEOPS complex subunit Pcc1 [Haloprofundus halobius]